MYADLFDKRYILNDENKNGGSKSTEKRKHKRKKRKDRARSYKKIPPADFFDSEDWEIPPPPDPSPPPRKTQMCKEAHIFLHENCNYNVIILWLLLCIGFVNAYIVYLLVTYELAVLKH
jgi:hypothetical protein